MPGTRCLASQPQSGAADRFPEPLLQLDRNQHSHLSSACGEMCESSYQGEQRLEVATSQCRSCFVVKFMCQGFMTIIMKKTFNFNSSYAFSELFSLFFCLGLFYSSYLGILSFASKLERHNKETFPASSLRATRHRVELAGNHWCSSTPIYQVSYYCNASTSKAWTHKVDFLITRSDGMGRTKKSLSSTEKVRHK